MGSFKPIVRRHKLFSLPLVKHQNYNPFTITNFFEHVLLNVH